MSLMCNNFEVLLVNLDASDDIFKILRETWTEETIPLGFHVNGVRTGISF